MVAITIQEGSSGSSTSELKIQTKLRSLPFSQFALGEPDCMKDTPKHATVGMNNVHPEVGSLLPLDVRLAHGCLNMRKETVAVHLPQLQLDNSSLWQKRQRAALA
mmetsp:Transcript_29386/g.51493  ORF Transcript_29386/g.51493 Transcript_29386/m.51493 type:complete len:105 (-) Transcript_29386:306-620(-)